MNKELKAIIEYDSARIEVIYLGRKISDSTIDNSNLAYMRMCKAETEKSCFERLWDWNNKNKIYREWEMHAGWDDPEPDPPEGEEPPVLCECCQVTQSLVDARKEAKKRFGIAKTRLSRIARDYRNSLFLGEQ